jgi:hypothetical protein
LLIAPGLFVLFIRSKISLRVGIQPQNVT